MNYRCDATGEEPGFYGGRAKGSLEVTSQAVVFYAQHRELEIPLALLELDTDGPLILFRHGNRPGCLFLTRHRSVLRALEAVGTRSLQAQVCGVRKSRRRGLALALTMASALLFTGLGCYLAKGALIAAAVSHVPPEWEVKLGDEVLAEFQRYSNFIESPAALAALERFVEPLTSVASPPGREFRFHIVSNPTINAVALPGGHVIVHTGLIHQAEHADEVLGVIAHELAHVIERHAIQQVASSLGATVLLQAVFRDVGGTLDAVTTNSGQLLAMRFSRAHETEADDKGYELLLDAGIDPRGLARLLERIQAVEKAHVGTSDGGSYYSSHPLTRDRIQHLEERWSEVKQTRKFLDQTRQFRILRARL